VTGNAPNYPEYSLEELIQARESIDANRYPERVDAIEAEIAKRKEEGPAEPQGTPAEERAVRRNTKIAVKVVAVVQILGGLYALGTWGYGLLANPEGAKAIGSALTPALVALMTFLAIVFAASVLAGILLLMDREAGIRLSIVLLGLQIVSFNVAEYLYQVVVGAAVYAYVRAWHVSVGIMLTSQGHIYLGNAEGPSYVAINVLAAGMISVLLAYRIDVLDIRKLREIFR
jgi:hypothetical protein